MSQKLLADIEEFLRHARIGEYRFGILAVSNGRLVERLRRGRPNGKPARVWPETEAQIRRFMRDNKERFVNSPHSKDGVINRG